MPSKRRLAKQHDKLARLVVDLQERVCEMGRTGVGVATRAANAEDRCENLATELAGVNRKIDSFRSAASMEDLSLVRSGLEGLIRALREDMHRVEVNIESNYRAEIGSAVADAIYNRPAYRHPEPKKQPASKRNPRKKVKRK